MVGNRDVYFAREGVGLRGCDWLCGLDPFGFHNSDFERDRARGGFGGREQFVVFGDLGVEDELAWLCGKSPGDGVEIGRLGGQAGNKQEYGAHGLELHLSGGEDVAGLAVLNEGDDAEV